MQGEQNMQTKGGGVQEGGGGYGKDSRTRKSRKDPKTRPGGGSKGSDTAFLTGKCCASFGLEKRNKEVSVNEMDGGDR